MEKSPLEDLDCDSRSSSLFSNNPLAVSQSSATASQLFHIEHLQAQYEHLLVLYDYHLHQMNTARTHQLFESYRDIVSSMQNVIGQYEGLLAKLNPDQ